MWKLELEKSNWRLLTPPVIAEHDILYPSKAQQFSEFGLLCNDKMYENLILLTFTSEKKSNISKPCINKSLIAKTVLLNM